MKEIKKILVPVDFSKNSATLLDAASYFAEKLAAELCVIFVVEDPFLYSGVYMPDTSVDMFKVDMFPAAETKMENFLNDNLKQGVSYTSKVLRGHVAGEITRFSEREKMDLIIIGTHGYKGFDKLILGSVADKVMKTATCPVMTIGTYG